MGIAVTNEVSLIVLHVTCLCYEHTRISVQYTSLQSYKIMNSVGLLGVNQCV